MRRIPTELREEVAPQVLVAKEFLWDGNSRAQVTSNGCVVNADDQRLIGETLAGQVSAFGELVRRHQDRLYNTVLRIVDRPEDAADVVQEAFVNAYQSLRSFQGDAEFFTWLYRIAFNAAISLRRKERTAHSLNANESAIAEPTDARRDSRPGEAMERREDILQLEAALAKLSEDHRQVLVLKDIEGLKYERIAGILEVPVGTVRSRLHRARLELHALLTESPPVAVTEGEGSSLPKTC